MGPPQLPRHDPWVRGIVLDLWALAIADERHHSGVMDWVRGTVKPKAYDQALADALRERGIGADDEEAHRFALRLCAHWAAGGGSASPECRAAARKALDHRRLLRPGPVLASTREELEQVLPMPPVVGVDEAMGTTRTPVGMSASPPVVGVRGALRSSTVPSVSPPMSRRSEGGPR